MKLKNKFTGEIGLFENAVDIHDKVVVSTSHGFMYYKTLAELNEEWIDYKEKYWFIDTSKGMLSQTDIKYADEYPYDFSDKQIGNYFETKEEAELALKKLKAWKRLKDAGFRIVDCVYDYEEKNEGKIIEGEIYFEVKPCDGHKEDLNLLFGGEE